jgi:hypothetical protein
MIDPGERGQFYFPNNLCPHVQRFKGIFSFLIRKNRPLLLHDIRCLNSPLKSKDKKDDGDQKEGTQIELSIFNF